MRGLVHGEPGNTSGELIPVNQREDGLSGKKGANYSGGRKGKFSSGRAVGPLAAREKQTVLVPVITFYRVKPLKRQLARYTCLVGVARSP